MSQIHPKVVAAGVGAQAAALIVYVASLAGVDVPLPVAAEIVAVVAFIAGYVKAEPAA